MAQSNPTEVTISNSTIIRIISYVVGTLLIFWLFRTIYGAIQLIVISGFLALALNPAVSWLGRNLRLKNRFRATAIAYLMVITFLVAVAWIIIPPFVSQTVNFIKDIPTNVQDLQNQDSPIIRFINNNNLSEGYSNVVVSVRSNLDRVFSQVLQTATTIGSFLFSLITVLVLTFMILLEGPYWKDWFLRLNNKEKERRTKVIHGMYRMVTGYVNGQLLIASIAGIFAFVAMVIASSIFDATINAVALAFIVTLIGLIPMIGNILASVVVIVVCLFVSLPLAITMGVYFLIYQQVENATLQPYIQSKYNELTPLIVFIAALVGIQIAGFLGALIAIPAAGCIRIYLKEYHGDKLASRSSK
mgnify:FL=1